MRDPVLRLLADLAVDQLGCVSSSMLRAAGIGEDHVASLVRRCALRRVVRGVFVVASGRVTHAQLGRAALLLAGEGGHVAGRSAAEVHGVLPVRAGAVTVARTAARARPARRIRSEVPVLETGRPGFITVVTVPQARAEWEVVDGVAAEALAGALRRVAADGDRALLTRAWREADFRGVLFAAAIEAEVRRGEPGSGLLAELLAAQPPAERGAVFRSRMEKRLYEALRQCGLPEPRINQLTEVGGRLLEFDVFFPDEGLAVEADGPHHRLPTRAAEDAERDRHVRRHGLEVLRFDDEQIERSVSACARAVEETLAERRRRGR